MLALGISTEGQYARAKSRRRLDGSAISYGLLQIGNNPTQEEIPALKKSV